MIKLLSDGVEHTSADSAVRSSREIFSCPGEGVGLIAKDTEHSGHLAKPNQARKTNGNFFPHERFSVEGHRKKL